MKDIKNLIIMEKVWGGGDGRRESW
jgi:hypothetical protein